MEKRKCYRCDRDETSREHVPPACIFPKQNDVGDDHRKKLITVPSCEEHNQAKTHDDEFLMAFITGNIKNNIIGYKQTKTKLKRTFKTKKDDYIQTILKNPIEITIKSPNGADFPVIAGTPDFERLRRCIESIAYGLYHHEHGQRFKGEVRVVFDFATYENENVNKSIPLIHDYFNKESETYPAKGENQEIFSYQVIPDATGLMTMRLSFFQGTHFFASLVPENTDLPFNLGHQMMQGGSKTIITYNGTDYEFN